MVSRTVQTICGLLLLTSLAGSSGCVGGYLSSRDPGRTPREGELLSVASFGSEQVQFTFRFKAGPDPKVPAGVPGPERSAGPGLAGSDGSAGDAGAGKIKPLPAAEGVDVRITRVTLTDRVGRSFDIVDQDVRRAGNVYHLVITTQAVTPQTYELTCQVDALVSEFQLKLAVAATREADGWRAVPHSFKFAVYGAAERSPYEFNVFDLFKR
jgi:hypothetical protein